MSVIHQAIAVTAHRTVELVESPPPTEPLGPNDVAGPTLATAVSPGTELNCAYQGDSFPAGVGYAAVFSVAERGNAVTDLIPGDAVFCMGPHRSWQRFPRCEVVPVPAGLTPEQAALARLVGISMSTLTTTAARPPERVLVTGLGIVGNLAAQVFASCGYEVTGVDPVASRRKLLERLGIRSEAAIPPDLRGVGLVLECSGNESVVIGACKAVRKRGEVVLVGVPWRQASDRSAHELAHAVFHHYAVLRSGWEWEVPRQPTDFMVNSLFGNFAAALEWLRNGRIRTDGLYAKLAPEQAQEAYEGLLSYEQPHLTVVFDWSGSSP